MRDSAADKGKNKFAQEMLSFQSSSFCLRNANIDTRPTINRSRSNDPKLMALTELMSKYTSAPGR